ncbi:hypothetical protein OKW30_003879 [Paraburkholderia sp. Clong3]
MLSAWLTAELTAELSAVLFTEPAMKSAAAFAGSIAGVASPPASGLAPNTDENTSGIALAYGFVGAANKPRGARVDAAPEPVPSAAACAPSRAFGVIAARSLSASATISTLPSSIVRFDSTTASGPSASRTRRNASRLVAPTNLRMFKLDPR